MVGSIEACKPLGVIDPDICMCNNRLFHQYLFLLGKKLRVMQIKNVVPFFFNNQDSLLLNKL